MGAVDDCLTVVTARGKNDIAGFGKCKGVCPVANRLRPLFTHDITQTATGGRVQRRNGQLSDILFISLNDRLNDISAVLAGCERIAYTPIPFAYTLILHRTVYLFCIMLPFALVVDLHYMTPFISVLISYTFISLDCLAEELEDPFGTENNDLPLDAICNAIEIDLLQMNDEAEIPAKILPDRHYQLT